MKSVIVVGAGLSGLVCARTLQRAGYEATVYEASDGVGGRVRTDILDGFRLDRGFQVLFTAYPALKAELDFDALRLQHFEPGAMIFHNGKSHILSDPKRVPKRLLSGAFSPLLSLSDKLRVPLLTSKLSKLSVEEIFDLPDTTMAQYLTDFGFSQNFLDRFIRPFYGGIFLEDKLETSSRMFAFVFKMLAEGETSVPAEGMGEMAAQIASGLKADSVRLNSKVVEIVKTGERATGVRLQEGEIAQADAVILATEADIAGELTGTRLPVVWRTSTELCFSLAEPLHSEKLIALFSDRDSFVNDASMTSNVAPSYAPPGKHLLSATVLGTPNLSDYEMIVRTKSQLKTHFPKSDPDRWEFLRIHTIKKAQFAQRVGIWQDLPQVQSRTPGLFLAGEFTVSSSLNGAMEAGRLAANAVMNDRSMG